MKKLFLLYCTLFTGTLAVAQHANNTVPERTDIKQLFFNGLRYKLSQNYEKSNESFSRVVAIDSENAAAWYEIALLKFRQNRLPEAETAIETAVRIEPSNIWYVKLLAELYKSTGDMERIIPVFDQLILLSPEQMSFYFDKANALAISGKMNAALDAYNVLEKKFGSSPALTRAKSRITEERTSSSDALARASQYVDQKNFSAASRILNDLEGPQRNQPLFFMLSGDVLYENGEFQSALLNYKKALDISDQHFGVWEKTINLQILLGEYKQLMKTAEKALLRYPKHAVIYYYNAFALHREGQNKAALANIKTALSIGGQSNELRALIYALQAEVLIEESKPADADIAFEKAIENDPLNYLIMNNYAYYLALRNENLDKALFLIDLAAKASPDNNSIADTYALILFNSGKYADAKTWIEKALGNKEAGNGVYLEHYGDILYQLGEHKNALVQWKKSKDAGNGSALLNRKIDEEKYYK